MFEILIQMLVGVIRQHAALVRRLASGSLRREFADDLTRRIKFAILNIADIEEHLVTAIEKRSEQTLDVMVTSEKIVNMLSDFESDPELERSLRLMESMRRKVTPIIAEAEEGTTKQIRQAYRKYKEELEGILKSLEE